MLTLIWQGSNFAHPPLPPPQIRVNIRAKFGIPNSPESPDIGQNSDEGVADFRISVESFINKNTRTSYDIHIKLGPVTKLDKGNTEMSKTFDDDACRQIVMSLYFFQFMDNSQPSGNRIPDAWSIKLTFSLITITFYLTKIENRTKKSLTQLSYYCFSL